jgi:hypothetical protein
MNQFPETVAARLAPWRELPIAVPAAHEADIEQIHKLIASLTKAEEAHRDGDPALSERAYLAGYDLTGLVDEPTLVLRYRSKPSISLPGVPLLPFAAGQKIHLFAGVSICKTAYIRSGVEGVDPVQTKVPVIDKRARTRWLLDRQSQIGVTIQDVEMTDSIGRPFKRGRKKGHFIETRFEARATIVDEAAFADALLRGIGRAKAYGFGLIQYLPA